MVNLNWDYCKTHLNNINRNYIYNDYSKLLVANINYYPLPLILVMDLASIIGFLNGTHVILFGLVLSSPHWSQNTTEGYLKTT